MMSLKIKRWVYLLLVSTFVVTGCSNSNSSESKMDSSSMKSSSEGAKISSVAVSDSKGEKKKRTDLEISNSDAQMVIYKADLSIQVKNFTQTLQKLEDRATIYGGYIAQSNVTREGKEQMNGNISIRIPQKNFQKFLDDAEGQATEVIERNITGQDVTEEYVDLESRLKSKRAVEERLVTFMKNATKTEDLLKISTDLATVQEEIEIIIGRMKYLQNQTAFSTVTINLYETKIIVPNIENKNLNTWERTKKQFVKSTNFLLAGLSSLIIFLLGNLPVIIFLLILGIIIILIMKKRRNKD
ncbi:DUF4349 domain-containing protein [Neobacillus sp. PS3-40]|uniref:DUF4349 domain-containing protein n=1 Tax=Neobacillus sp. PS3-40 TaxID=3070679 RepID=UPI0027E088E4|nr:DUF4349 domain-containing protein [Neobacillus sp. PS3-40]WML43543.1 DUF4349 domain-containing protein [Neobacillus sp. PS3-40]